MDYAENRLDRDSSVAHPPVLLALRHGRNSEALTIAVTTLVAAIEISPLPTAVHDLIGDVCQALEFVALPELSVRLLSAIYDFTRPHDPANIPAADTIHAALSKSFPDLLQPLPPSSCVPLSPPPLLSTLFLKQSYAQSHPPLSILSTPLSLVANSAALHLPQYSDFYVRAQEAIVSVKDATSSEIRAANKRRCGQRTNLRRASHPARRD